MTQLTNLDKVSTYSDPHTRPYGLVEESYLQSLTGPGLRAFLTVLSFAGDGSVTHGVTQEGMLKTAGLSIRAFERGVAQVIGLGALSVTRPLGRAATYRRVKAKRSDKFARVPVDVIRRLKHLTGNEIRVLVAMHTWVNKYIDHTWVRTVDLAEMLGINQGSIRRIRGSLVRKGFLKKCNLKCSSRTPNGFHHHLETPESPVIFDAESASEMAGRSSGSTEKSASKMTGYIKVVDNTKNKNRSSRPTNPARGPDSRPRKSSKVVGVVDVEAGVRAMEDEVPALGADLWGDSTPTRAVRPGVTKDGRFSPWLLVQYFEDKLIEIKPLHHTTKRDKGALGKQFRTWHEKSGWTAEMCVDAVDQFFSRGGAKDRLNAEGGMGIYFQFIGWTGHNQGSLQYTETKASAYTEQLRKEMLAKFDAE